MKTILSLKTATSNPADGIDNFNRSIFNRLSPETVQFYSAGEVVERGVLKKIPGSIWGFLRKNKPEMIWGNGHIKELPYVLFAPRGTKYIINFHTVLFKGDGPWNVRTPWFLRKFLFDRADLILCPSSFSAQSVRNYFPEKNVLSILNGVELGLFDPKKNNPQYLKEKYQIDGTLPIVAFVGALSIRKRPDLFIELAKEMSQAQFVMVGRALPEFDALSAAKDVKNFQWISTMPREDVAVFLASSAAFVFPSLNDASAAVILEAMASGAVPLVSRSGGSGEFIKDSESGFSIEPAVTEKSEFLGKLTRLLGDEKVREAMSRAARAEAERHSWDMVAKQYEQVIIKT